MKKICCIVLTVLCILPCLAGCGKVNAANEEPLIRGFVIGNSTAEIQTHTEDGETRYVIAITLPTDTDFKNCAANVELAPDAVLSMDSPCIVNELGGRLILNLALEERDLVVTSGELSQTYSFQIELE
jgi:hypothetical protein